ncbi:WD40-repeat-containing domain protein [Mycena filopes]|nr:WD40-repeat-containing domain protein [Mycena filopes]
MGEPLIGHSSQVRSVLFSPDGKQIASGSSDHTIRLWDAETGAPMGEPLTGHSSVVGSVVFSPSGKWIASGSNDHTIRIWDAETSTSSSDFAPTSQPHVTPDPLVYETAPSTILTDGWILNSLTHRLMWVPAWLRTGFCGPSNLFVITPRGVTTLDLTNFVHGTDWQKCKV